jgi:2,5-diketo-D-gluconate reductase A
MAFQESLDKLGLDYVDLYLIHWPVPMRNKFVDAWRSLIELQQEGKIRSIGVSNFNADHVQRIIEETGVIPAINKIELHPLFQQADLRGFNASIGVQTLARSPLGMGKLADNEVLAEIAERHEKNYVQIILRWQIQLGNVVLTRSTNLRRIKSNSEIFDFHLEADEMSRIAQLNAGTRLGDDPETKSYSGPLRKAASSVARRIRGLRRSGKKVG